MPSRSASVRAHEAAAERLAAAAETSARTRSLEADLRSDLFLVVAPYVIDVVGVPLGDIKQEGVGIAGRFDSMFGRAIVEYKRPGLLSSSTERESAARQGIGYLEDPSLGAQVVIITDGETWGFLRDVEAGPEPGEQAWLFEDAQPGAVAAADRFAWHANSVAACVRVLTLLETLRSAPVTAESVVARLGPSRSEVIGVIDRLADSLAARGKNDRADTLFLQWIALAGVTYGISDASARFPAPGAQRLLGSTLVEPLGHVGYAGSLFVLHSYVSLATKLLACEMLALLSAEPDARPTQWLHLDDRELGDRLAQLEGGELTARLGAPDMLAGDLFGWWVPLVGESPKLAGALRGLLQAMGELAWGRVANAGGVALDLLRNLYQSVVPAPLRKALGEFFTPRWVAERVLQQALDLAEIRDDDTPRILDPACGSGTFLVAALRSRLAALGRVGKGDDPEAIETLLESIIGFDINPVSPVMTRVNLLLALGDKAQWLPEKRFRVYQADSILLPEQNATPRLGEASESVTLPLEIGDVVVPYCLATLEGIAILRGQLEAAVAHHRSIKTFKQRLSAEMEPLRLSDSEQHAALDSAAVIYERFLQLEEEGRDGIWSRIVEQSFSPLALGEVDLVVGNPPWISWKDLPERWKARSESTWRRWGLWQTAGRKGIPLSDVSTLLLARCIATYCPNGVVALLLPRSVLISDPSGTRARRCHLLANQADRRGDDYGSVYRPIHVDLFDRLKPFSPDAANEPVALYLKAGEALSTKHIPWPSDVWERRVARSRLGSAESWGHVAKSTISARRELMEPVDLTDPSTPWARQPGPGEVPLRQGNEARSPYQWGRGYETRGADSILFLEVVSPAPVGRRGLVTVETRPDLGRNGGSIRAARASIEPALLWPLVKGSDVRPWHVRPSDLYAIVAHDIHDGGRILTEGEVIRDFPKLFDLLEPHLAQLRKRSLYRAGTAEPEGPWGLSGPMARLAADRPLVLVRYIASGGRPAAAVVVPDKDARLGRVTTPLPNNKTNIYFASSQQEAHYLAGWINSYSVQAALERYAAATGITPAALERLPIPRFDRREQLHADLAAAARACAAAAGHPTRLIERWTEVDRLVARIAGVQTKLIPRRTGDDIDVLEIDEPD